MKKESINFDDLSPEQVGALFPIHVVPYNPQWKVIFEQERALIASALGEGIALNIEHFGSTSVEGLASKPTIDMLVEVDKLTDELKQTISEKLEPIGYGNMRNADKENRMTFGKGYGEDYLSAQTYHLHIREKGNVPQDEIYFRDYLRRNPDARDEYAKLKCELAEMYEFNREMYTQAKTEFVARITELAKVKA